MNRAAFLDRDGTIIMDREYVKDPERVQFIPGAPEAIRSLQRAGYKIVVITNQSGIARGILTESDYQAVKSRLDALLLQHDVVLDGVYYCPHHPDFSGPCDCRKPALKLYEDAARNLDLDLANSVYIGDRVRDVSPALATGGRGILVLTGWGADDEKLLPKGLETAADLADAARRVVEKTA
ncbi:MAG TPA: HAD family hydrolase [Longimicrobiales bacterium]|nr:HAD family hydrolase [Longimicrobiales bacterium]